MEFIDKYKTITYQDDLSDDYQKISQLTDAQRNNLITSLEKMYGRKLPKSEQKSTRIKFSSSGNWVSYDIIGMLNKSAL